METLPSVHQARSFHRGAPGTVCGASVALSVTGFLLHLQNRTVPGNAQFFDPVQPAVGLVLPALGAFILSRAPGNRVGWLWCAAASIALAFALEQYAVHALITDPAGPWPGGSWAAWLGSWLWVPSYLSLWTLVPLLFPDGRLPSPGWRPVLWASAAGIGVATLGAALAPGRVGSPSLESPVVVAFLPPGAGYAEVVVLLGLGPVCLFALLDRYRRSPPAARAQLRWVTVATALALLVLLAAVATVVVAGQRPWSGPYQAAGLVTVLGVPAATMAALVRHRLLGLHLEVDALVNRFLVYGSLVVVGVSVYLSLIGLVEVVSAGQAGFGPSLVALAGVVLVVFQLRRRVQRTVDRLLYRKRDYDYRALSDLGRCVQSTSSPAAMLPAIVGIIAERLKLPYVGISVGQGDQLLASAARGEAPDNILAIPLVHQGHLVGQLAVAPRDAGESFDAADRRLLDSVADQVSVAAYALSLTAELQRSRERLVTAREEERRRLRRDLHDGLKPALAGVSLGLDAVRNVLGPANPTDELIARLRSELDEASSDIRRLVYDLRPPALDELGLVGALRQQSRNFGLDPAGLEVVVEAPSDLGGLPAAVEVAAYRIALEALENVRKHARAGRCEVVLGLAGGYLELEVRDDGTGLPPGVANGVGLIAMHERAAELGGTCTVEPRAEKGTLVRAVVPIADP